ncbi:response regulator transcription factor [Nonomuraea soli]|uniref:Two-component system response regulator DesR n=1 Tax=Nonomuraea soli TaxID=1032476 RepID=A0A7W0CL68_9ACTN|nr:response regulator transcription factor [Nonomuraea soli]MBA2893012.1 two-component system response regulator DesR [Nonomuraea soli]NUT44883.1 response regulator transcription factor [Thermoactinospora sp.]
MIRVLIADDEALIRGALVALLGLEGDLEIVAEEETSTGAVAAAVRTRPDVAVLDLEMPPGDGLVAAEQIDAPVVLVTRHARPGVLRRALSTGVRAFVPKTTPASRLAEIIREVHAGRRYVDPDIAASALTENDCPLTARELEVLRAARSGESIAWISEQVHLAPGTVRNYLSSAMAKIGVSSRHAAAQHAWEQGWI